MPKCLMTQRSKLGFCSCSIEYPNDKLTWNWRFMFETFSLVSLVEYKHSPSFNVAYISLTPH